MTTLKVARVVLHSDRRKMGRENKKADQFRRHLQASYANDLGSYQERLRRILAGCAQMQADITLLPACAVLHRSQEDLDTIRSFATGLNWLAAGCLRFPKLEEFSEVWHHGKPVQVEVGIESPKVRSAFRAGELARASFDGLPVVMAQSSDIRSVYKDPHHSEYRLALDLGHGQYGNRYQIMTLPAVEKRGPQVVLAFWRDQNGSTSYGWYAGHSLSFDPVENRKKTPEGDWIDIFRLEQPV